MSRINYVCGGCKDSISAISKPGYIIVHGAHEHNLKNICF